MSEILLVVFSLLIGIFLRKTDTFPKESAKTLNLFVIYISLPALILLNVKNLEISLDLLTPILTPWILIGILGSIILFLSKRLNLSRSVTGALLLVVPLGNTSFVGVPFVKALFGESAVAYALIYDQFGTFLALITYGTIIISLYGSDSTFSLKETLKKIVTFPPFISLIIALVLNNVEYHSTLNEILNAFALTLVPLALIAVGLQLEFKVPKEEARLLRVALFLKLILPPTLLFIVFTLFFQVTTIEKVTIIESAFGSMITAGALAIMTGLAPRLTAAIVGYSTIISFITVPLIFTLL